ncbi:Bug family tripartite tricarboxylate transporter substrate binding protein [Roseibium aggregatum]|uniref:Tripartite tricarboxylate transporter substrate binding protein n=1 Tax=Roseibium aggregatum TaxID=187304 RepID=A0A939J4Z3_9HYPH|nr:tripartite tricarboxylate transporter substrate binding protein [Roseibium aggregatum]MBN9671204.1 tripartite tricarboxylate transporter substrate binding protein [Roseibium aggregatum]
MPAASRLTIAILAAGVALAAPAAAEAGYPERPVRILVSFPPGGSSDLVARLLAEELSSNLGQQFVVENKPGAAGTVAATELKNADNDGYTLMLSNLTPFSVAPTRFPDTPYDPVADFSHIAYLGAVHLGMFASPELGTADMASFVEKAKAEPGTIDYGSSGVGSWGHVFAVAFENTADVELSHIPYKGSGPMRLDFRADVIPVMFDAVPQNLPNVEEGNAIPLAVSSPERLDILPDTPTFTELGYDIVAENWLGISGPAGIDAEIVDTLQGALAKALKSDDIAKQFDTWGIVRSDMSSEEFTDYVAASAKTWEPLVKQASK